MAKTDNLTDFLVDVADAIREKKGTSDLINPQSFSDEIRAFEIGGGSVVSASPKAVNFRDYDGTILYSYSKDEFLALNELPPLPTREGLICQEWNWDYADAKEYVTEYGVLEVGATYITDDGKTRLYISVPKGRQDVPLYFSQTVSEGVTIDWGDGSVTETLSGTGNKNTTHHYNEIGGYVISLDVAEGCTLGLGHNTSSYNVMGITGNKNEGKGNILHRVEIGSKVQTINNYAFLNCYSLATITIPQNVTQIFGESFRSCYSLCSVVVPKSVTYISSYAFRDNHSLNSIVLPHAITDANLDCLFYNCYALTSLNIPQGITSASQQVCYTCYSLSSVIFPQSITHLGNYAFSNCNNMAIYDFSASSAVPTMASTGSLTVPTDCKIVVPDALYDEWIAATNWSTYASKIVKASEFNG